MTTRDLKQKGLKAMVVRLPPSVHDAGDYAFVLYLIRVAREQGHAAYIGDGQNRWPTVHRLDVARLFRLALEQGEAGSRYHGIAEASIPFREIAELIGRRLNVSVVSIAAAEAPAYFGWIAHFAGASMTVSSEWTQQRLHWHPTHLGLLAHMDANYFND